MKDQEILKNLNDMIVITSDEPLEESIYQLTAALMEQYELQEEEIRAAVDFEALKQRQQALIRELIVAYVQQHPYEDGTDWQLYCDTLIAQHPLVSEEMIADVLQDKDDIRSTAKTEEASVQTQMPVPEKHVSIKQAEVSYAQKKLASHLRICGKIIFWIALIAAGMICISSFILYLYSFSSLYYMAGNYGDTLVLTALLEIVLILFGGYVLVLIVNALACLLDKGDPDIPFIHFREK